MSTDEVGTENDVGRCSCQILIFSFWSAVAARDCNSKSPGGRRLTCVRCSNDSEGQEEERKLNSLGRSRFTQQRWY